MQMMADPPLPLMNQQYLSQYAASLLLETGDTTATALTQTHNPKSYIGDITAKFEYICCC